VLNTEIAHINVRGNGNEQQKIIVKGFIMILVRQTQRGQFTISYFTRLDGHILDNLTGQWVERNESINYSSFLQ
jgi:hypothetical protein